jgi:hypothetical protein
MDILAEIARVIDIEVEGLQSVYRRDEFEKLFNNPGFTSKRLIYWNAVLFPVVFAVRRLQSGGGHGTSPRPDPIPLPGVLNRLLTQILTVDTWACTVVGMPFGTSVFVVAVKPVEVDP